MANTRRSTYCSNASFKTSQRIKGAWRRQCDGARLLPLSRLLRLSASLPSLAVPRSLTRYAVMAALSAMLGTHLIDARAQDAAMLDERVTQQSVADTICRPGYADRVSPPFDELKAHKDQLLAARGIGAAAGLTFALDRRVPVVLGGSPDAPANLDLLPWAGHLGERRKARAAVMLKHCVCAGKLSLADAQAAIVGNWSAAYTGLGQTSCGIDPLAVATGDRDGDRGPETGRAP